jgi:hypothetical protein
MSDSKTCGCGEHGAPLSPLAAVLHGQRIGCNWEQVPHVRRAHFDFVESSGGSGLSLAREVVDVEGPVHDGWHHPGDHEIVATAIGEARPRDGLLALDREIRRLRPILKAGNRAAIDEQLGTVEEMSGALAEADSVASAKDPE